MSFYIPDIQLEFRVKVEVKNTSKFDLEAKNLLFPITTGHLP